MYERTHATAGKRTWNTAPCPPGPPAQSSQDRPSAAAYSALQRTLTAPLSTVLQHKVI
jgi:hypothetical protein